MIWDLTFDGFLMAILWYNGQGLPGLTDHFPRHPALLAKSTSVPVYYDMQEGVKLEKKDIEDSSLGAVRSTHLSAVGKHAAFSPEELRLIEAPNTGLNIAQNYLDSLAGEPPRNDAWMCHPLYDREDKEGEVDLHGRSMRTVADLFSNEFDVGLETDLSLLEDIDCQLADPSLRAESIQLGLLRLMILAVDIRNEALWNDAMDAYRMGEATMRRGGVLGYHLKVVMESAADSPLLKKFMIHYCMYQASVEQPDCPTAVLRPWLERYPDLYKEALRYLGAMKEVPGVQIDKHMLPPVIYHQAAKGPLSRHCAYHWHDGVLIDLTDDCPKNCSLKMPREAAVSVKKTKGRSKASSGRRPTRSKDKPDAETVRSGR